METYKKGDKVATIIYSNSEHFYYCRELYLGMHKSKSTLVKALKILGYKKLKKITVERKIDNGQYKQSFTKNNEPI